MNLIEFVLTYLISKLGYFPYIWRKPIGLWDLSDLVAVTVMGIILVAIYASIEEMVEG